jgi:dTDP-L-rhamnose 4-epimerase
MNILVTGGAGFIGTRLVERLATFASVTVVDSLEPQIHGQMGFPRALEAASRCLQADVRDPSAYKQFLDDVDVLIHLASQTGTGQSMYELGRYVCSNGFGTAQLLESILAAKRPPARVILASSRAVYGEGVYESAGTLHSARRSLENLKSGIWEPTDPDGNVVSPMPMRESHPTEPTSVYGLTKLWQEQLVQTVCGSQNIDSVILRLQPVFGPGQAVGNPYAGIVGTVSRCVLANEPVDLFEVGLMTRDFLFIDDAVAAIEAVVRHEGPLRGVYNVGSGSTTSLSALVDTISTLAGRNPTVHYSGRFRVGDVRHAVADMARFRAAFCVPPPMQLEDGLTAYLAWFAAQPTVDPEQHLSALSEMASHALLLEAADRGITGRPIS